MITILVFLLTFLCLNFSNAFNCDLIFSLQSHFKSDLILLPEEYKNENIAKKLSSRPKAFIGLLDLDNYYKSFVTSPVFTRYKNKLVILDDESNFVEKLIRVQRIDSTITTSFIWIFFMKNDDESQNLDLLNIRYDSKFFIVKEINFGSYEITDVYQISSGSPKIYSSYALWENKELKLLRKNIFSSRMNLQGYVMRIANRFEPNTKLYIEALSYLKLMSEVMNFTLVEIQVHSGLILKNGTKTGTFKAIYDNVVDAGTDNFAVSTERLDEFDFIFPTRIRYATLYVKVKQSLNWKAFIAPFESDIYISFIIWFVLAYFLMRATNSMISPLFKYRFEDPLFNLTRAFCSQGGRNMSKSKFSFYICLLMPYLLGIVLLQNYSANLLANLTVEDSTPPFRNLEGVIRDGTYKIACQYPSYIHSLLFIDENRTDARKIKDLFVPLTFERVESKKAFKDICRHRWVLITGDYNHFKSDCKIVRLVQKFCPVIRGIITKKNFPYQKFMMKLLRHIQTVGLEKLYEKGFGSEWENDHPTRGLELKIVFPAFLLLVCFLCLSVLILLFEIIIWRLKKRHNRGTINRFTH